MLLLLDADGRVLHGDEGSPYLAEVVGGERGLLARSLAKTDVEAEVSYDRISQLVLPWKAPTDADDAFITLIARAREEYSMMAQLRRVCGGLSIATDLHTIREQVVSVLQGLAPPVPAMTSINLLAEFGARLLKRKFKLKQPKLTDWIRGALTQWEHSEPLRQRIERSLALASPMIEDSVQLAVFKCAQHHPPANMPSRTPCIAPRVASCA